MDRPAIKHGTFASVKYLDQKIRQFLGGWNERKYPFARTKSAE